MPLSWYLLALFEVFTDLLISIFILVVVSELHVDAFHQSVGR